MDQEEIEISTLTDIVNCVPEESLDAFLIDLRQWVEFTRNVHKLASRYPGFVVDHNPDVMRWIDDGKNDFDVNMHVITEEVEETDCTCGHGC